MVPIVTDGLLGLDMRSMNVLGAGEMLDFDRHAGVLWQKQRRGQIAAAASAGGLVLLPTGAVEQHGPHLPLDTDSWTAFTICVLAAEQIDRFPVLVLPPIWWGLSPYWMTFPGTLTLRPETLINVICDIARSVGQHGFRKLVIVNGHGGNSGLIEAAAIKASNESIRVAALSYWNLIPDVLREVCPDDVGNIGHAGEAETSIQLYLQPNRVDLGAVQPDQCTDLKKSNVFETVTPVGGASVYLPPDPLTESPQGIYGQAVAGSREKGERVLRAAAERLTEFSTRFSGRR